MADRTALVAAADQVQQEFDRADRPHHDPAAKQGAEQLYAQLAITADDVAEVIVFAVTRPRRMTLNEILLRPTSQPG